MLGMIVGSAMSSLVDEKEKRLTFDNDEMETDEVHWYLGLTQAPMKIGSPEAIDFGRSAVRPREVVKSHQGQKATKASKPAVAKQTPKAALIDDMTDTSRSVERELLPYAKPDSDHEDEDDDPTLVNRVKLSAPV